MAPSYSSYGRKGATVPNDHSNSDPEDYITDGRDDSYNNHEQDHSPNDHRRVSASRHTLGQKSSSYGDSLSRYVYRRRATESRSPPSDISAKASKRNKKTSLSHTG